MRTIEANSRSNPTGRAHSTNNANTDTPRTNAYRRGPLCAHTYMKYKCIVPDVVNDHTRGPPSSCIWRYGTPTLSIYPQQDETAIEQIFKPRTLLCTSDASHYREIITKYSKLANEPKTREVWITAFGKEFGSLSQGDNKTGEKGTNSLFLLTNQ